jgi:hypothetical protein
VADAVTCNSSCDRTDGNYGNAANSRSDESAGGGPANQTNGLVSCVCRGAAGQKEWKQ